MNFLSCSKNNCLKIKGNLELAKLMTWGDSHGGFVQLQPISRLPGRHSKAHWSHKDGENKTWIWSLFFLHILSHIHLYRLIKTLWIEKNRNINLLILNLLWINFQLPIIANACIFSLTTSQSWKMILKEYLKWKGPHFYSKKNWSV